ncbi:MAG: hypothetical protein ACPGVB_14695 [Chitinophagales bacterium]
MSDLTLKFNQLGFFGQQEVMKFINFMLQQENSVDLKNVHKPNNYKQRILQVSVWSEEDLQVFDETKKQFNSWQIQEW